MEENLDKLNGMLTTPELQDQARAVMKEYQNAIDAMMVATVQEDIRELTQRVDPQSVSDLAAFAGEETARRMSKYGSIFFEEEMERILDSYNDEKYELIEFKIRCEILTGLKDSLINFEFSSSSSNG